MSHLWGGPSDESWAGSPPTATGNTTRRASTFSARHLNVSSLRSMAGSKCTGCSRNAGSDGAGSGEDVIVPTEHFPRRRTSVLTFWLNGELSGGRESSHTRTGGSGRLAGTRISKNKAVEVSVASGTAAANTHLTHVFELPKI